MPKIFSVKDKDMKVGRKYKKDKDIEVLEDVVDKMHKNKKVLEVELGTKTMLFIVLILAMIFFGNQLIIAGLFIFISFVVMSAAKPVVNWLGKRKVGKGWAVVITYGGASLLLLGLLSAVSIPFIEQMSEFVEVLPTWSTELFSSISDIKIGSFNIETDWIVDTLSNFFQNIATTNSLKNITGILSGAFGGITLLITAVIFSIYILLDHDSLLDLGLVRIPSDEKRARVKKLVLDMEHQLGSWMLGQLTVSSIAGITLGLFLALMGVPFALPLGVMILLLDSIPNIGATIATIPAVLVALFALGPVHALIVLAAYVLYQQIENNIIIPKIMGNAVGIKPVIVMLGAIIFLIIFGLWGAIVAVPVLVLGQIIYDFYIDLQKLKAKGIV